MAEWRVKNEHVRNRWAPSQVGLSEVEGCPENMSKGQEIQMSPGRGGACWWRTRGGEGGFRDETEEAKV